MTTRPRWRSLLNGELLLLTLLFVSGCYLPDTSQQRISLEEEVQRDRTLRDILAAATGDLRTSSAEGIERAFAAFELARDLNPEDPRVYDGLGCVEYRRKHFDLAGHFFRRAIELAPEYDRPYAHLALIAEQKGDMPAAAALFRMALRLNPLNFRARNNYAAFLVDDGDSTNAYKELRKAYQSGAQDDIVITHNLEHLGTE